MKDFFENAWDIITLPIRFLIHYYILGIWILISSSIFGYAAYHKCSVERQERNKICGYIVQEHCENVGRTLDPSHYYTDTSVRQWWKCPRMNREFSIDEDLCKDFDLNELK